MNIEIARLRRIADQLLTYLEETGRSELEISEDFYWLVEEGEVYNPSRDPSDLTMGQLSDDWSELEAILDGKNPPIGYALVWLSAILRIVGEKTVH